MIIILFSNLILKAESEAEKRASDRRFREIMAQHEERVDREADRIYNERYGPGKQDILSIIPSELIRLFILVPALLAFVYMFAIAWEKSYGPIGSQNKIKYTNYYKHFSALRKPLKLPETLPIEQKVFLQNGRPETKNHPNGIHGFNSLVIEYANTTSIIRKKEIEEVFKNKAWGVPYLKEKERLKYTLDQIAVFPCPQCKGGIDSSNLKEGGLYTCPHCNNEIVFRNQFVETPWRLYQEYGSANSDRKWEIYNIFKKQGWGLPY